MIPDVRKIYLFLLLLSFIIPLHAQRSKTVVNKKNKAAAIEIKSQADILYENMLSATAKIIVIDSIVVDKDKITEAIPLDKENGRIGLLPNMLSGNNLQVATSNDVTGMPPYAYMNEFGNRIYFPVVINDSVLNLRSADRLGGKWIENSLKGDFGNELSNIAYPFMMPDGITLYFSAESKDGLGGRDIYVTMYDTDSARFYKPENIGLPYNSSGNDYYCIIDEFNALGWIVSDRRQPKGKVCVYTFVPSETREVYETDSFSDFALKSRAAILNIKDTWTDKTKLAAARLRLEKLVARRADVSDNTITFTINDSVVYTDISQFKSSTGKARYTALKDKRKKFVAEMFQLEALRLDYSNADKSSRNRLGNKIKTMEINLETTADELHDMEKQIRNAENLLLKNGK